MPIALDKTRLLTDVKNAVNQLKEQGALFLYVLSRTISKNLKYLLMAIIILGSFLKPIRTLPGMGFIDKYNYNMMFLCFGLIPLFWSRGKMLALDALVYASLFFTLTSFVIAGAQTGFHKQAGFAALFIFPASTYFIFRHIPFSEESFIRCIKVFVVIGALMIILEFLSSNYFISFLVFAFADFAAEQRGNIMDKNYVFTIPFLGGWWRAWGVTGRPQATGSLFAALAVFFFAFAYYHRGNKNTGSKTKLYLFLALIGLFLTGGKTGTAIFLWMFLFILFGFNIVTFLIVPLIGLSGAILVFLKLEDVSYSLSIYMPALFEFYNSLTQTDSKHWFYTLFGQGEETLEFSTEVALIESFLQTGFFNYLIFFFILITYTRYVLILGKQRKDPLILAGLLFTLSVVLGSLHYESLFIYPCNVLVLAFIGFTAKRIHDLMQREKRS